MCFSNLPIRRRLMNPSILASSSLSKVQNLFDSDGITSPPRSHGNLLGVGQSPLPPSPTHNAPGPLLLLAHFHLVLSKQLWRKTSASWINTSFLPYLSVIGSEEMDTVLHTLAASKTHSSNIFQNSPFLSINHGTGNRCVAQWGSPTTAGGSRSEGKREGQDLLRFPIGLWVQYQVQVDKPICLWGGIEAGIL